jgi:ribosomal protein S18 acetylase RimI-like enzyme
MKISGVEQLSSFLADYRYGILNRGFYLPPHLVKDRLVQRIMQDSQSVVDFYPREGIPDGCAVYKKLDWDSEHFGFNVGSLHYLISRELGYKKEVKVKERLLESFNGWCSDHAISFVSTRVDAADLSTLHALERAGFYYVETLLTFGYRIGGGTLTEPLRPVQPFQQTEVDELAKIAANSFVQDRFHSDPYLDPEKSNELYRKWVINSCRGRAQEVLVVRDGGRPVGFITCQIEDLREPLGIKFGIIDLIAVSPENRGRNLGTDLVRGSLRWFAQQGVDIVRVGTQAANIAGVNMYLQSGFKLVHSELTLHKWFKQGMKERMASR